MSILGGDFEENISQAVESQFVYCDIVVRSYAQDYTPMKECALIKIGEIIGPLEPVNNDKLHYIKDYGDIMQEINNEFILRILGIKKIWAVSCNFIPENYIVVKLFIKLISGANTQYDIIYKNIKETKRS